MQNRVVVGSSRRFGNSASGIDATAAIDARAGRLSHERVGAVGLPAVLTPAFRWVAGCVGGVPFGWLRHRSRVRRIVE